MTLHDNKSRPRRSYPMTRDRSGATPWILGAILVLIVLGLALWAMNETLNVASTPPGPTTNTLQSGNPTAPTKNSLQQGNTTGSANPAAPNGSAPTK